MRYDLRAIMKRAWDLVKKAGKTMSEALIISWDIAKNGKAQVAEWFECKLACEMNLPNIFTLDLFCAIKETEKAVYAMFRTGYTSTGKATRKCAWVPKKAIENIEKMVKIADYDEAVAAFRFEMDM